MAKMGIIVLTLLVGIAVPTNNEVLAAQEPPGVGLCHLNYAQIHFGSVAAFVAGWRSS